MVRKALYRITDTRDNTTREGYFLGSGDWGMRFTYGPTGFQGFQVDEYLMDFFIIEEI